MTPAASGEELRGVWEPALEGGFEAGGKVASLIGEILRVIISFLGEKALLLLTAAFGGMVER
jgi:hypothetical protein